MQSELAVAGVSGTAPTYPWQGEAGAIVLLLTVAEENVDTSDYVSGAYKYVLDWMRSFAPIGQQLADHCAQEWNSKIQKGM
jgi:hypothetical protein